MKIEVRSKSEAVVSGYVNAVARDSRLLPKSMCAKEPKPFYEQTIPGLFTNAIKKADNIELRYNHRKTLGGTKDGVLKLREDNIGLWAEATLHGEDMVEVERSFEGIKKYLEEHNIEGLVFWYKGEPACKIKRSDFGFSWPMKK